MSTLEVFALAIGGLAIGGSALIGFLLPFAAPSVFAGTKR